MFKYNFKNLIYCSIVLFSFLIFFSRSEAFHSLKFNLLKTFSVPIYVLSFPIREAKKMLYYHRTFDEYRRLKSEVDIFRARITAFDEVIKENKRLEDLLAFKRRLIYSSVAASVIGRDPLSWNSSMMIDKGAADGIKQGLAVVNSLGVVGKVAAVSRNMSKVILLIDPQFSVAALVQRPRESVLVSGTLQENLCRLKYINPDANVSIGDKVITSKLSSSFPEGLLIGEVIDVNYNTQNQTIECALRPVVQFSQLEEVLVIIKD